MVLSSTKQSSQNNIFVVTDVPMQLLTIVVVPFMIFITYENGLVLLPFSLIVIILAILRFRALLGGIRFDLDADSFQFPGGGIEANSILDYVNPMFFLQWFRRFDIPISEIQSVNTQVKFTQNNEGKIKNKYFLRIVGSFGSASIKFSSEGKLQQCYTLLAQANEMGIPVSNR